MFVDIPFFIQEYIEEAQRLFSGVEVTNTDGQEIDFETAITDLATRLLKLNCDSRQLIFLVGNGGSAGISSETSHRLWKFCNVPARTFNDPVIMSSTANDHGWEEVFSRPLLVHGHPGDILVAVSSSGRSQNIINAIGAARSKSFAKIVTLSGFDSVNPLRILGDFNFYVRSDSYRHVERTHLFILDCLVDVIINLKLDKKDLT